jgi:magnesium and cobalt transporter
MTPLGKVVSVAAGATVGQTLSLVRESVYSRYPVFGDSANDIIGIVMIRDILEAAADGRGSDSIRSIVRPTLTVPAGTRSDHLLLRFRHQHTHLAVVQQEGRTIGVVSLEDVLEELVGEIEDETDVEESN